ncbi:MAG TPA: hypothetical protein VGK02_10865 [Candidatus Aquicultor sp.]
MEEEQQPRYGALIIASTFLMALGYIVIAIGVFAVFVTPLLVTGLSAQLFAISGIVIITVIQALLFFSLGQVIQLVMDIDDNLIVVLQHLRQPSAAAQAPQLRMVKPEEQ